MIEACAHCQINTAGQHEWHCPLAVANAVLLGPSRPAIMVTDVERQAETRGRRAMREEAAATRCAQCAGDPTTPLVLHNGRWCHVIADWEHAPYPCPAAAIRALPDEAPASRGSEAEPKD